MRNRHVLEFFAKHGAQSLYETISIHRFFATNPIKFSLLARQNLELLRRRLPDHPRINN